ncbi:hypothetical protein VFPFJ_00418 [Purpureocillium lilacinum]|uniref:Uncharacterized protein n=1 Tax=Purpureocillium lilacinum TaxID=33203 RepID=A0A179HXZ2_PURLI|nr:hypothetical protein VFPFJ_00418 [Purpureocillium lilacinum]OAQ86349.1 hypothetical protein VFPBJ_00389 [Purpureocillium lilacinum]OAQ94309.1 hypothetical protein VFPFJ_00418 [Purpureocillium lilacinum]
MLPSPSLLCLTQHHSTRHPSRRPGAPKETAMRQSTAIASLNGHFSHGSTPRSGDWPDFGPTCPPVASRGGRPPVCHGHTKLSYRASASSTSRSRSP